MRTTSRQARRDLRTRTLDTQTKSPKRHTCSPHLPTVLPVPSTALSPHNDRTPTVDETLKLNITDTRHDSSPRQRSTKHAREGWWALVAPAWTAVGLKLENMLKLARVVGTFVSILFVLYSSNGSILYTLRPITCTRPNGTVAA